MNKIYEYQKDINISCITFRQARGLAYIIENLLIENHKEYKFTKHSDQFVLEFDGIKLNFVPLPRLQKEDL